MFRYFSVIICTQLDYILKKKPHFFVRSVVLSAFLLFGLSSFAQAQFSYQPHVLNQVQDFENSPKHDEIHLEVLQFLQSQKLIRVFIDQAPGYGHQAAGSSLIRRLRQLGYKNEIEVIYDEVPSLNNMRRKLQNFFPGLDPAKNGIQRIENERLTLIPEEIFSTQKSQRVILGFIGASDKSLHYTPERMNSEIAIRLQPLSWGNESYVVNNEFNYLNEKEESQPYYLDYENTLPDPELFGVQERKTKNLKWLQTQTSNFIMGAIYGVGLISKMPEKISFYLRAIDMAFRRVDMTRSQKVLLPILSNLNDAEWNELQSEVQKYPSLSQSVQFVDSQDQLLSEVIRDEKSIILVKFGNTPQVWFEWFMHESQLPVWVAGKNSMAYARQYGKVFINTVGDYRLEEAQLNRDEYNELRNTLRLFEFASRNSVSKAAHFVVDSLDSKSWIRNVFSKFKSQDSIMKKDKVLNALSEVLEKKRKGLRQEPLQCIELFRNPSPF